MPDIEPAWYPAILKARYQISGYSQIPNIRPDIQLNGTYRIVLCRTFQWFFWKNYSKAILLRFSYWVGQWFIAHAGTVACFNCTCLESAESDIRPDILPGIWLSRIPDIWHIPCYYCTLYCWHCYRYLKFPQFLDDCVYFARRSGLLEDWIRHVQDSLRHILLT